MSVEAHLACPVCLLGVQKCVARFYTYERHNRSYDAGFRNWSLNKYYFSAVFLSPNAAGWVWT